MAIFSNPLFATYSVYARNASILYYDRLEAPSSVYKRKSICSNCNNVSVFYCCGVGQKLCQWHHNGLLSTEPPPALSFVPVALSVTRVLMLVAQ